MQRWSGCWVWGVTDQDDPRWYESLTQFRQPEFGQWEPVIDDIARIVKDFER
jgi:hypothetical protein